MEIKNRESNSTVLFSKTLTRQIWENLFLKEIKIICSVKQDLNLWEKNIKLDLSKEPIAPGKPATLFSDGNKEPGKQLKSSIF